MGVIAGAAAGGAVALGALIGGGIWLAKKLNRFVDDFFLHYLRFITFLFRGVSSSSSSDAKTSGKTFTTV